MSREEYININYDKYLSYWSDIAIGIGIFVILSLVPLDYIVSPSNFKSFLIYRLMASLGFIIIYFLNKRKINRIYQSGLAILAGTIVAIMIAAMIVNYGGHQSVYFAGIILLIIYVFGLIPFTTTISFIAATIIYLTYLLPIIAYDTITNKEFFISANVFILACTGSLLLLRYLSHKRLINEFSLQYELAQEKDKLRTYSTQLEELVAERTKELEISEQRYRELFDSANDGIVVFDENGVVLDVNRQFCTMYAFEKSSLIGANLRLLEVEDYQYESSERLKRIVKGEPLVFETEHYKKDGSKVIVEVSSKAIEIRGKIYVQSFHRDITEKKRLLEQLFQSQKMESIGILAGGIAHDFNNFLSAILGHAELLGQNEELDATSRRSVKTIESSTRKAGQIVSKLLSFARKGKFSAQPLNFNDVLRDAVELLERIVAKKKAVMEVKTDTNIPIIEGDSTQLEQVIMNLVMNATDAMPQGGTITIATSLETIERNQAVIHPLLTPGKYVLLRVADTGTGIPDEIRDKIFDPFFTTKESGKGTGLGLAIIYGIVREHNGVITVTSLLGRGTTFDVYLPAMTTSFF